MSESLTKVVFSGGGEQAWTKYSSGPNQDASDSHISMDTLLAADSAA